MQDMLIRPTVSFIGTLLFTFPGINFGSLYYRLILKFKDESLKYNLLLQTDIEIEKQISTIIRCNFNAIRKLSENTLHEILWWKKNIFEVFKSIRYLKISITT